MSLANLIAKQKAAAAAKENPNAATGVDATASNAYRESSAERTDPVVPDSSVAQPAPKLKFALGKKPATPAPTPAPTPSPTPAATTPADKVSDGVMSLDDLAGSDDDFGTTGSDSTKPFAFADEIPCTAPDRELSPDLTSQQLEFVTQLNSIYEVVHDPELFGGMIRTIMQELQENPDYMDFVQDQDVHTMIRGLRSSMGLAKVKKAEKSTKARGSKKAPASAAILSTAEEMFNSEDW